MVERSDAKWFTSSYSSGGQECVEVAHLPGDAVGVRDSKNRMGPALMFESGEWVVFTEWIAGREKFGGD